MDFLIISGLIVAFLIICFIMLYFRKNKGYDIKDQHVMITGGSSGIGKSLAIEAAKRGANISILARNLEKLKKAKAEISSHLVKKSQKIEEFSVDLGGSYDTIKSVVDQACSKLGTVGVLINCAGYSISNPFEEIEASDFQNMMNVNYFGSVFVTKAALPAMKKRHTGRICFVSSQAGQVGIFGFSAYSASKFAIRGMAEALHMELKPYNIPVTVSYPPDTDTPGYAEEMKSKPLETHLISETSGLLDPDYVGRYIFLDTMNGHHASYVGLVGWMVAMVTSGMSPFTSVVDTITQIFLMGPLRIVVFILLHSFDGIVKKCKNDREQQAKNK